MNKKFSVFIKGKNSRYNKEIDGGKFPDKSITHRAFILASQCLGVSKIKGLNSDDIKTTIAALKKLGIKIISKKKLNYVYGNGISGFKRFRGTLNFKNSGTGARSFLGILTCYPYQINITGDESLKLRPFKRLTNFLEDVSTSFHSFWNKGKENESLRFIDDKNIIKTQTKLIWLQYLRIVYENIFKIIGIDYHETM